MAGAEQRQTSGASGNVPGFTKCAADRGYEKLRHAIPQEDRRSLTGVLLGDPLPERSALAHWRPRRPGGPPVISVATQLGEFDDPRSVPWRHSGGKRNGSTRWGQR